MNATWRRKAVQNQSSDADCKSVHAGSIPAQASIPFAERFQRLDLPWLASFLAAMSRSCCEKFPSIFNGRQSLAAAPCDMGCDMERARRWRIGRAGKVALALLILNEIRGIVVVVGILEAWLHRS
jgi:hypothetical protein